MLLYDEVLKITAPWCGQPLDRDTVAVIEHQVANMLARNNVSGLWPVVRELPTRGYGRELEVVFKFTDRREPDVCCPISM